MSLWEKWRNSFDDRMPIYRQIILLFYQAFVRGEISPGERIPSIREMAAYLKVNTNTMQRVYQEMERTGLISSKRGTGYFLTEDVLMVQKTQKNLAHASMNRFIEEMRAIGSKDTEIIEDLKKYMEGGNKDGKDSGN